MNGGPSIANRYAYIGMPFIFGAIIWLAVGVPYNMIWLFVVMLAVGMVFALKAKKLQEEETAHAGEQFIDKLKNKPTE